MHTFAINGFGRIGRLSTRVWWQHHRTLQLGRHQHLRLHGCGRLGSSPQVRHHFGLFPENLRKIRSPRHTDADLTRFIILHSSYKIPILAQRDPAKIPWGKYAVDVVIESTGAFTSEEKAKRHLLGGAKQVVISAPAKGGNVPTSVIGVNEDKIVAADHQNTIAVLNNASCTTNCVAPIAIVVHERLGILKAAMTTIHSYTDDQNLQDASHHDLRRARAAAQNIVPTSTGAAIATTETIPELKGLFDGIALRVPTITGSVTDFTFLVKRKTTVEKLIISSARPP